MNHSSDILTHQTLSNEPIILIINIIVSSRLNQTLITKVKALKKIFSIPDLVSKSSTVYGHKYCVG